MKPSLRMGIAAIALMSSIGMAAAAESSQGSLPNASASQAADSLKLTSAQEKTIWQDVSNQHTGIKTPAGFSATLGAEVPGTVLLHPLPTAVTNSIAATRPYEYAMLDQQVLIVNPVDKKVVDIITQAGASG